MCSNENQYQAEESSGDVEQENEYDGVSELMGNLAPYEYELEPAISASSQETESS